MLTRSRVLSALLMVPAVVIAARIGDASAQAESNLSSFVPGSWASDTPELAIRVESAHVATAGELFDKCLPSSAPTPVLRFAYVTRNEGFATLITEAPPANAPVGCESASPMTERQPCPPINPDACARANKDDPLWVWQTTHCHYHRRDYGHYSLFDATTKADVVLAGKFSFNLEPVAQFRPDADPDPQGLLKAGWEDIYNNALECQFVPLPSDLPAGSYNLVADANLNGLIAGDARMFDNTYSVRLRIENGAATPEPAVWTASPSLTVPSTNKKAVSVVSRAPNQYDLFYIGNDGLLYLKHQQNGAWGTAVAIAKPQSPYALTGAPAAIVRRGILEVFARANDGRVIRFYTSGGSPTDLASWSYYPIAGSTAVSSPVAQNSDFYSRMVAWLTPAGAVQYQSNEGVSWSAVATLTGATFPVDQTPSLAASGSKSFHLFLRDGVGQVVHNLYYQNKANSVWQGWTNLGGAVIGGVSATSAYMDRIDVFARGADNQLLHKVWQGDVNNPASAAAFTSTWQNEGSVFDLASDPTAIATGANAFDVIFHARATSTSAPVYKRLRFRRDLGNLLLSGPPPSAAYVPLPVEQVGALPGVSTTVPVVSSSWAEGVLDLFVEYGFSGAIYVHSLR